MNEWPDLTDIRTYLRDPPTAFDILRWTNRRLNQGIYRLTAEDPVNVMARDWDNLIILDGCRSDVFDGNEILQGESTTITSQGGHSKEFLKKTFAGKEFHDTIYITTNPWSEILDPETFFKKRTTYTDENRRGTARLPQDLLRLTLAEFDKHPDKRYIVHFMQPNNPYVGPIADELRETLLEERGVLSEEMYEGDPDDVDVTTRVLHLRRALKHGYISREEMLAVYQENFALVARDARYLAETLGGKTAITADHGDMFGERLPPLYFKEYSHWRYVYTDLLREVPWHELQIGERRETRADPTIGSESIDERAMQEQLESMGYLDV